MRKIGLINDIEKVKSSRWTRRILTKYPIDLSNVELFNITVKCLVALTKSKRISLKNQNVLFTFNDLSEVISSKSSLNSDMARYLLAKKFKRGHPLLRTQGHRLIAFLRTYFHYAPDEIHEVIYDIRKHIAKMQWYWRKYDPHFFDLKTLGTLPYASKALVVGGLTLHRVDLVLHRPDLARGDGVLLPNPPEL